jgi:NAD(P)-dependent dehydrogenase (short-subunit alcohol dehydrogenase family)
MKDKRVVVTGAASGIGRAVAVECFRRGAHVAALDIDEEALLNSVPDTDGRHRWSTATCDVSSEVSVADAFDRVAAQLGGIDAVFANAGIEFNAPLHEFDTAEWRKVVDINLVGVFLTCREAIRKMVDAAHPGSIVCTSSPSAFIGFSGGGNSAYAASKGGISAFVRSAGLDYAPRGIRVNAVVPGATQTPMLVAGLPAGEQDAEIQRIADAAKNQVPLGRLGRAEAVASAVIWLLSDESSYVTGTNLVCDGGLMAKSANDF